ncbi:MAG: tautomerase [Halohasta sp.]
MPYLALDTTAEPTAADRRAFTSAMTDAYTEIMETTAGHVAVAVRTLPDSALSLGRAVDGPIAVLNADVRRGRPFDQRRRFGLAVVDWLADQWAIPRPNLKIVFTEHEGHDLMGADRVGGEWSTDEA